MKSFSGKTKFSFTKTAALLIAAAVLIQSVPATPVRAESKIEELEQRIKAAKEEKEQTQERIRANKEEIDALSSTATSLKGALNDLNSELTDVSNNLEEIEKAISDKNNEIAQMELDLEEALRIENDQYEAMKIRIKYMYEDRNYDLMETLFGSSNFSDFLNRSSYFESIASYDRKKLDEFKHTREVVEEAKALLEEEKLDLDDLKAQAEEERDRVMQLVNRTSDSLTNYQNEIEQTEKEMEENEAVLAEQQANISALQKELEEERRLSELAKRSAWRDISQVSFAEEDRYLLANLIYCEAGNQPYEGQVAVGAVVINRVLSSVFPDTVAGVIYQNKQFSPVGSGRLALALARNDATAACYSAADAAMSGTTTVGNCLFFRTPIEGLTGIQIGGHIFY